MSRSGDTCRIGLGLFGLPGGWVNKVREEGLGRTPLTFTLRIERV
jgi:hypothetical protein